MVKGLLIVGVGLVALIDAAFSIYRGGNELAAGLAIVYAAFAVVVCGAALLFLRRARTRLASPLVDGDVENWTVNLAISLGMLAAFCLALFLQGRGMDAAARLVDPILVGLVVILTLGVPIRMAGRGLLALLNRAPDQAGRRLGRGVGSGALTGLSAPTLYVRVLQPGRTTYVWSTCCWASPTWAWMSAAPTSCAAR